MRWSRLGRGRRALLVGLGVVLVGAAVWFGVRWSQRGADEASTGDAVDRFRRQSGGDAGNAGFLRPAAGVYEYTATGTERLSLLSTGQQWGPTIPASVTHESGDCWTERLEFSTNHWQERRYCAAGSTLQEMGDRLYQSFDFVAFQVGDTIEFTCSPPADAIRATATPGDSWTQSCEGRSPGRGTRVTSAGNNTFVGREKVRVGGDDIDAVHYRLDRTLTGDQRGTERREYWYAAADGQLLRGSHDITVASPSPIGDVTYTEKGEFTLTSREPRR